MEFKLKIISGIRWSVIHQFINIFIRFGFSILLARLLSPQEFGLIGMVRVFLVFLLTTSRMGLNTIIIQEQNITNQNLSTIFWAQVIRGIAFSIIFFFLSNLIAIIYGNVMLVNIAKSFAPIFMISALNNTHWALIRKSLDYKLVTKISSTALLISGGIGVILAWQGFSYRSLIVQQLTYHFIRLAYIWLKSNWIPGFHFNTPYIIKALKKGLNVTGYNALNMLSKSIDSFIVGKFSGEALLGIYDKSYQMTNQSSQLVTTKISNVMLPSFALIQNRPEKVKLVYIKILKSALMFLLPLISIVLLQTENIIRFTYGIQWISMTPFVQFFSVLTVFSLVIKMNNSVFNALGNYHLPFRIGLIFKVLTIGSIIFGYIYLGISGIIIGYILMSGLSLMPELYYLNKLIQLKILEMLASLYKVITINAITLLVGFFFKSLFTHDNPIMEFSIVVVTVTITYMTLILFFENRLIKEIWNAFQPTKKDQSSSSG